jgi:hypothetical protein
MLKVALNTITLNLMSHVIFRSLDEKDKSIALGMCENRNDPYLVQAFLKKWWVESDFKAPNLPLSLRLKGSGCHYNSIHNNTGTK